MADLHPTNWPSLAAPRYPDRIRALRVTRVLGRGDDAMSLLPVSDPAEAGTVIAAMEIALDRYASPLLRDLDAEIVVVSAIRLGDAPESAGLVHPSDVGVAYVSSRYGGRPATIRALQRTMHAELSSVALRRFGLQEFRSIWPDGPATPVSSADALRLGRTSRETTRETLASGYLHEYASTNAENDFNSIVVALVCERSQLTRWAQEYPRIQRKMVCTQQILDRLGVRLSAE